MNRIFDCFTFFNELDLLEFRLEYLDPVVDYFVIAESNLTHSGNEKPYNYHNNSKRYEKWSDKIIYLPIVQEKEGLSFDQVNSYTPSNGSWILENQQRNSLSYVYPRVGDKDLVLIGDLDEIPELGILMYYKNLNKQGVLVPTYSFRQLFHYYYMN